MNTGFSPAAHIESSVLEQKDLLIKAEKELRRGPLAGAGVCYQELEEVAKRAPYKGQRRKASYCVSDFYK